MTMTDERRSKTEQLIQEIQVMNAFTRKVHFPIIIAMISGLQDATASKVHS